MKKDVVTTTYYCDFCDLSICEQSDGPEHVWEVFVSKTGSRYHACSRCSPNIKMVVSTIYPDDQIYIKRMDEEE